MVTYDVNTTTTYNAAAEAVALATLPAVAGFLGGLLAGGGEQGTTSLGRDRLESEPSDAIRLLDADFGGWLRNVPDEGMTIAWPYIKDLVVEV